MLDSLFTFLGGSQLKGVNQGLRAGVVVVKIEEAYLNFEGEYTEGLGIVVAASGRDRKVLGEQVRFLKEISFRGEEGVKEFEAVPGKLCVKTGKCGYLEYPLKVMMIKELLVQSRVKLVAHVTENAILAENLREGVDGIRVVTISSNGEAEVLKVIKFGLILLGAAKSIEFSIPCGANVAVYEAQSIELDHCICTTLNLTEWFSRLNHIRRSQFLNSLPFSDSNSSNTSSPPLKNERKVIKISAFKPVALIPQDLEIVPQPQIEEIVTAPQHHKSPIRNISIANSFIANSIEESNKSLTSMDDLVDIRCLSSPRNSVELSNLEEAQGSTLARQHRGSRISYGSTDCEEASIIDHLTSLINKYRNPEVLEIFSKLKQVYIYKGCGTSIEGTYIKMLTDSSIFEGQMNEERQPHGFGSRYFSDGTVFRGFWKNGKACGQGLIVTNEGHIYNGNWKQGLYHGYGCLKNSNGYFCEGKFKYGELEGIGMEVLENGEKYHGEFTSGMRHGCGTLILPSGLTYLAEYLDGKLIVSRKPRRNINVTQVKNENKEVCWDHEISSDLEESEEKTEPTIPNKLSD